MAIILGEIDSLKKLKDLLKTNGVSHLESFDQVLMFKNTCDDKVKEAEAIAREEYFSYLVRQKERITKHVAERKTETPGGPYLSQLFVKLVFRLELYNLKSGLFRLEKKSEKIIRQKISQRAGIFLKSKSLFDSNYALIQGASGEQKALDELKKLPDSYYVINNFQHRFFKPIYNKRSQQRIYSIQADHIVLGPSGVFLIETKNWSKNTIKTATSFTPIDQLKRTGFALFLYLNPRSDGIFSIFYRAKKISVNNVLLMTGQMTNQRDSFVKVVNLLELISYITYSPKILNDLEIKKVLNKLQ